MHVVILIKSVVLTLFCVSMAKDALGEMFDAEHELLENYKK